MGFNWIYWILMGFNGYANVPFLQTTPGDFRNLMELDSKKTFPYDLSAGSIDVAHLRPIKEQNPLISSLAEVHFWVSHGKDALQNRAVLKRICRMFVGIRVFFFIILYLSYSFSNYPPPPKPWNFCLSFFLNDAMNEADHRFSSQFTRSAPRTSSKVAKFV